MRTTPSPATKKGSFALTTTNMQHTFIDQKTGEETIIPVERWAWGVVYEDDTELRQFGQDGKFHQFKEIETERVKYFVMFKPDEPERRIDVAVEKGAQLFHFYRHVVLNHATPEERKVKAYAFGWKKGGQSAYHFILPDDRMVFADHDVDLTHYGI